MLACGYPAGYVYGRVDTNYQRNHAFVQHREGRATAFAEAFSGGVFLAAALLDLIPDSFEDFGTLRFDYFSV